MSLNTEDCSDAMNSSRRDYEPLLNTTIEPSTYLLSNDLRNQHRKNTPWLSLSSIATLLYAFVVVIGQVTQYVTLPMWIDSTKNVTSSQNQTVEWIPTIDSFFVLSFASSVFVTVFGSTLVINIFVFKQYSIHKTDWNHRRVFLTVGFFQGLAAVFIVFSSSGERTPPYLQAILGNFSIPITLLLRYLFLKKVPTRRKLLSAVAVVLGLFISLIPTFYPHIDPRAVRHLGGATGAGRVLWPLAFMLGFGISALSFVMEEKAIKLRGSNQTQAGLVSFLFWTSLAQFLVLLPLFWVDIIPGVGQTRNLHEFIQNWIFGIQCIFGGVGCSWSPGVLAFLFITGYIMVVCGCALLLRYSEGATLLAIVMALCTPLGFIFWMLFQEKPFQWHPYFHTSSWFNISALIIMIPAVFIYNTGMPEMEREEIQ